MNADERRFVARAYIALVRLFFYVTLRKNQEASPQSAQSPQRAGGAGVWEDGGGGGAQAGGAMLPTVFEVKFYKSEAINFWRFCKKWSISSLMHQIIKKGGLSVIPIRGS